MSHLTKSLSAFILLLSLAFGSLMAQEPTPDAELEAPHDKKVSLSLEARGDYQRIYRRRLKLPPPDENDPLAELDTELLGRVIL